MTSHPPQSPGPARSSLATVTLDGESAELQVAGNRYLLRGGQGVEQELTGACRRAGGSSSDNRISMSILRRADDRFGDAGTAASLAVIRRASVRALRGRVRSWELNGNQRPRRSCRPAGIIGWVAGGRLG